MVKFRPISAPFSMLFHKRNETNDEVEISPPVSAQRRSECLILLWIAAGLVNTNSAFSSFVWFHKRTLDWYDEKAVGNNKTSCKCQLCSAVNARLTKRTGITKAILAVSY